MYISEGSNSQLAGVFQEGLWGINLEFWSVCFIELSTRNLEKKMLAGIEVNAVFVISGCVCFLGVFQSLQPKRHICYTRYDLIHVWFYYSSWYNWVGIKGWNVLLLKKL